MSRSHTKHLRKQSGFIVCMLAEKNLMFPRYTSKVADKRYRHKQLWPRRHAATSHSLALRLHILRLARKDTNVARKEFFFPGLEPVAKPLLADFEMQMPLS